jgi:N-acylneuraminate cytidylyltransferase
MIAFIPVRGGSKSIPKKNIKPLCGRPLLYWVLDAAVGCEVISRVFVSTDDGEIAECVRAYGNEKVEIVGRGEATATDTASTESAMVEFARGRDFDHLVLIQATSPLLRKEELTEAVRRYRESGADSLVSAVRQRRFTWAVQDGVAVPLNYDPLRRPRRQEFDGFLVENGAFYVTGREALLSSGCRLSGKTILYEMAEATYFELDEPSDWEIIEGMLRRRTKRESRDPGAALKGVKLVATDVDGVLTDAGMYYSEKGDELKKFNTRDGKGFEMLRSRGITTAIITGENTQIVERRARKLKVDHVLQGIGDKAGALRRLCECLGIGLHEVAYIGDDINDLEVLRMAGYSACPRDAVDQVKAASDYICRVSGGKGCVRELSELILGLD